jgi:hypothetical protein
MATSKEVGQTIGRSTGIRSGPVRDSGDLGANVFNPSQSGNIVLIILLMLLVGLLLPLMASMYFDSLTAQKRTERNEARIEKLIKELEKKLGKD